MRFLKKAGMDETKLQMTPMIDIVFQLLIFFLVATRFRIPEGELEAYMPEEGAPVEVTERDLPVDEIRVTLRVSQGGPKAPPSVLLDNVSVPGSGTSGSMRWVERELQKLGHDPQIRDEVPVIIEAEPHLAYQWVIHTLNVCRRIGFKKINFAASKRNAPLPEGG